MGLKFRPDVPGLTLLFEPELNFKRTREGFFDFTLAKEVKLDKDCLANVEGSDVEALHPY